jgi:hypothetical protein
MTEAARDIIIEPMLELYLPPLHLRQDAQAQERALAAYEKALAGFDRDTLQRGWNKVVAQQTYWVWPNPGTIAEACRQCQPRPTRPSEEEQRREKALDMAEAYTARYMKTSHLGRLARQEGWSGRLREYVADAAWVQAQLLCQVKNIGWNARLAEGLGTFHSSAEAFAAYRKTITHSIERGQIRVHIPQARVRQWKEQCGHHRDQTIDTDAPETIALNRL